MSSLAHAGHFFTTALRHPTLIFRAGFVIAALPAIVCTAAAAPARQVEAAREFNIPAGDAAATLRQLSAQAGVELLYSTETVAGVRTRPVQGRLSPPEALAQLLRDTPLQAQRHPATGGYAIIRPKGTGGGTTAQPPRPRDNAASEAAQPSQKTPETTQKDPAPMKSRTMFALLAGWLVAGTAADAQTAVTPPKEDPIVLSPFMVTTEQDRGYLATSTLAGTRIKTDLRDLGAAISVVTPEFMADTGTTNIEEVLTYTTSTEVGGPLGNYSAANLADAAGRPDQDAARREPQSGARVRGLGAPNFTRQYFSTSIPGDSYNTGSITFNRGANSLLFGLGSAAGVIDSGLKTATIGQNSGEVTARYGSFESIRTTFGYNVTLLPKRVALRVDALYKNDRYQQEPAFDREKRVYTAVSAVLLENKRSRVLGPTLLRGNFEAGEGRRTPPTSFAPTIGYAPFFLPPPNFTPYTGLDYTQGGGYAMLTQNWRKWAVNDTRRIPGPTPGTYIPGWYEQYPTAVTMGRPDLVAQNHSSAHIFAQLGIVYNGSGQATIGLPGSNLQSFQGWIAGNPQYMSNFINTRAYEETGGNVGFKAPTLTDRNVFDYKNQLITGDLQDINRKFEAYSLTLEQSFFQRLLGVEATLDRQRYHIDYYQPFGTGRDVPVYIDTSLYLPNEMPNPNVGRAFLLQTLDNDFWRDTKRQNGRVTGYLDLDVRKWHEGLGRWVGRHVLTGLWQEESQTVTGMNYRLFNQGVDFDFNRSVAGLTAPAALRNQQTTGTTAVQFLYISDDLRGKEMNEIRLRPISIPRRLRDGDTFNTAYYDINSLVTPAPNTWKTGAMTVRRYATGGTASRFDVTSKALAWQSYLLGRSVVGLAGWRSDKIQNYTQVQTNARSLANEYLPTNLTLNSNPASSQEGNTFTWSVVAHAPEWLLKKLPRFVSGLSAHYGIGENFSAIAERYDVTGATIPNPSGKTKEYGLSLGFADNKWIFKANRFETSTLYNSVLAAETFRSITEVTRPLNNYQTALDQGVPFNRLSAYSDLVAAGITSYDQLFAAIKNLIPQPARAIYDYQLNANRVWALPSGNPGIRGLSSTQDVVSKGWEVELTANPTADWRISFNAVKVEAQAANTARQLGALQDQYQKNLLDSKLANVVEGPAITVTMFNRYNNENVATRVALQPRMARSTRKCASTG